MIKRPGPVTESYSVRGSVKSLHPIYDRTRGELNVPEGYAVRLQHIGRSQFNAVDPLAIYVPERLTHDYALHPHAWRWTFGALTGKDGKKIRYYKPVLVPIRPGTLVAEMKFASRFLHDPEDVESARLYQSSVQPLKTANLSDYEQPELLIPRIAVLREAQSAVEGDATHVVRQPMKRNARVKVDTGDYPRMHRRSVEPHEFVEMDIEDAFYSAFLDGILKNYGYIHIDNGDGTGETWNVYDGSWYVLNDVAATPEMQLRAFVESKEYTLHVVPRDYVYPRFKWMEGPPFGEQSLADPTQTEPVIRTDDAKMAVMKAYAFYRDFMYAGGSGVDVWLIARGLPADLRPLVNKPFKNMVIYKPWIASVDRGKYEPIELA